MSSSGALLPVFVIVTKIGAIETIGDGVRAIQRVAHATPRLEGGFLSVLLGNGMTSGSLVAIVAILFMEITASIRKCLRIELEAEFLPELINFLRNFASSSG